MNEFQAKQCTKNKNVNSALN